MHTNELKATKALASSGTMYLTEADRKALNRFVECCDDSEAGGHDVPPEQMRRLRSLGVVTGASFSSLTAFGLYVHSNAPQHHLPLTTLEELNAREAALSNDRLQFQSRGTESPAPGATLTTLPAPSATGPNGEPLYSAEQMIGYARDQQLANYSDRDTLYKVRDYAEERSDHELHNMITAALYCGATVACPPAVGEIARDDAIRWAEVEYRNDDTFEGRELEITIAAWQAALRASNAQAKTLNASGRPYFLIRADNVERIRHLLGRLRQHNMPATANMIDDALPGRDDEEVTLNSLASASVRSQAFEDLLFRFAREAIPVSEVAEVVDTWHTQASLATRSLTEQRYARVREPSCHFDLINKCLWLKPEQFDRAVDNLGEKA